jgi:hypothetical protein
MELAKGIHVGDRCEVTVVNSLPKRGLVSVIQPGANPTTLNYNAGVVKIYSATNSILRFYIKYSFYLT